jgi:anti-sigma B factor antagonist
MKLVFGFALLENCERIQPFSWVSLPSLKKEDRMSEIAAVSPLTLDVERNGDVATVKCHGKLVLGVCDLLSTQVRALIPNTKRIVLDLTDLKQMDSMGLGTIVRLYASAKTGGSCVVLVNLAPRIRQLLGITNLLSVLTDMCEQGVTIRF